MNSTKPKLTSEELSQFTGSENWYRWTLSPKMLYTDGVRYVAENAGAYWLIDAIFSHVMTNPKLRKGDIGDFQIWELELNGKGGALLTCRTDTDAPIMAQQEIPYTDFPFSIKFYCAPNELGGYTVYLPSEH